MAHLQKKEIKYKIPKNQELKRVIDYGDFCILITYEYKTNYNLFSRFVFDVKTNTIINYYYCEKNNDEIIYKNKMKK